MSQIFENLKTSRLTSSKVDYFNNDYKELEKKILFEDLQILRKKFPERKMNYRAEKVIEVGRRFWGWYGGRIKHGQLCICVLYLKG